MMKRIVCVLLALCMAAALLPAGVLAQELPQSLSGTWINPLYEGVVAEDDLTVVYPHEVRRNPDVPDVIYHTDIVAAAEQIREYIERREEVFSVGFQIPYEDYTNDGLGALAVQIIEAACAHTGVPTQGDYLKWQYGGAGFGAQGYSHNDEKTAYNSVITFSMIYYSNAAQEREVTKRVEKLLRELKPTGTDYEKLTTVYDWICDNVVYDYEHLPDPDYLTQYTAYGALIDGTSVCQGFSLLLYRLALEVGIDCRLITGIGITPEESGAHSWNILKLDGKYYNADATWDINYAENDDYVYYLINEADFGVDHIRDEEFTTSAFQSAYPMDAANYNPAVGGDDYPLSGTCGKKVTWTLTEDGTLTISGEGEMANCSGEYMELPWWDVKDQIVKIVIEDGVTSIGDFAFTECQNLKQLDIGRDVTSIGMYAFQMCSSLESVEIPDQVTSMDQAAFSGCSSLVSASIGEGMTEVSTYTFHSCTSLTDVKLGSNIETICYDAFYGCTALARIDLPAGVKTVETKAFYGCTGLEEILFPEGLETIDITAFGRCTALTSITIPASVTKLGMAAFSDCTALEEIRFEGDVPEMDGSTFSGVTATAYYPKNNDTWTEVALRSYGGTLTWVADGILSGDLNGDGTVDDGDVALLLWYTLFPDNYTISGNADVNGDEHIDDADVAYLLWHTLFPENYPLK